MHKINKIVALVASLCVFYGYAAQPAQDFTPETLMQHGESLKNKDVTFEGKKYKVTKDRLYRSCPYDDHHLSRWVTLRPMHWHVYGEEVNFSAGIYIYEEQRVRPALKTGSWSDGAGKCCEIHMRKKTYTATWVKTLGTAVLVGAGVGIGAMLNAKPSNPTQK